MTHPSVLELAEEIFALGRKWGLHIFMTEEVKRGVREFLCRAYNAGVRETLQEDIERLQQMLDCYTHMEGGDDLDLSNTFSNLYRRPDQT